MGRSGRRIQTFKKFVVHDDACGMKVGTDALLLGSWAGSCMESAEEPISDVLDIGTGSGILALMLAQRFPSATVHAVELEPDAAIQASENAARSPFRDRVTVYHRAFQGWDGSEESARMISKKKDEFVKFRWLEAEEEGEDTFFELRIRVDDLTGENSLLVTDFADDDEVEDAQDLWHAQVDKLRRVLGC